MFSIHASFPAFHDCIKSISVMFVASNIITILEPICFSSSVLNELTFPQREPGMEKVESQRCLFFCQRSTVEWHAATFQHGRNLVPRALVTLVQRNGKTKTSGKMRLNSAFHWPLTERAQFIRKLINNNFFSRFPILSRAGRMGKLWVRSLRART